MTTSTTTKNAATGSTSAPIALSIAFAHGRRKVNPGASTAVSVATWTVCAASIRGYASLFAYFSSAAQAFGPNSFFQRS
jgi:hypothetical protein